MFAGIIIGFFFGAATATRATALAKITYLSSLVKLDTKYY